MIEIPVLEGDALGTAVGFLGGAGGAELLLRSRAYASLDDALSGPADLYLSRSFWAFLPYVAAELRPADWLAVRAMAGALITVAQEWEAGDAGLSGPPESFGGPFLCLELAFGGRAPEEGAPEGGSSG